jgi:hypothetical protein
MGGEYLYISNNKRSSWNYISEPPAIERELLTDPSLIDRIFIFPGYYLTEDGGYTWTVADSGLPDVNSYLSFYFDTTDKTIFYNLRKDGLYKTRNNPINWQLIKGSDSLPLNLGGQGFQYYDIGMLKNVFIDTLYNVIYVGTASGIYKKDLITEVKEKTNNITSEFILNQNYPNPFNPTTTISYQIPEKRFVTISVYDVLGNEIATLVNKEQPAGKYDVEFDATRLSSGVYFYRLQAGSYFKIKKMVLTK